MGRGGGGEGGGVSTEPFEHPLVPPPSCENKWIRKDMALESNEKASK